MIPRSTVGPKVSVKVSTECSTIFSSANTSRVGQGMSKERNEHPAESEMEGIRKNYIYWHFCSKIKYIQKKEKKTVVPVPLLLVPVPAKQKLAIAFWYRYHTYWYRYLRALMGQFRVFFSQVEPFSYPYSLTPI